MSQRVRVKEKIDTICNTIADYMYLCTSYNYQCKKKMTDFMIVKILSLRFSNSISISTI